jgi:choline dehydrogenase-like flavoprotein
MLAGPALSDTIEATTLDAIRGPNRHDAIVIGAGAAGSLAASLLVERGLRVLLLDAGLPRRPQAAIFRRMAGAVVRRLTTPGGLRFLPPALIPKGRAALRILGRWRQPIQSRCYAWERAPDDFVDDRDCPYITPADRPFVWIRSRMLGGRVAVPGHGRQYYRFGPYDFAPADGLSPHWPFHPNELNPWYALVERRLRLAGTYERLPWLPDSELAQVLEPTGAEAGLQERIAQRWPGARPILSRYAPPPASLESAAATGRLRCRPGAIVREIDADDCGHVRGVVWHDQQNGTEERAFASLVFLCASALESTRILLLSRSARRPDGLGAASGVLGRHLMDHVLLRAEGEGSPLSPTATVAEDGRCIYLPRFDARDSPTPDPGRGFGVQLYHIPAGGRSYFIVVTFAEMLPRPENRVTIDPERRDAWGIPILRIECAHSQAELVRAREQASVMSQLADLAEVRLIGPDTEPRPPGTAVHECGTARMGRDPANSVVDPDNQCWEARGLYLTDGACFPSQGNQNPTLTILALTARACDHALRQLKAAG